MFCRGKKDKNKENTKTPTGLVKNQNDLTPQKKPTPLSVGTKV